MDTGRFPNRSPPLSLILTSWKIVVVAEFLSRDQVYAGSFWWTKSRARMFLGLAIISLMLKVPQMVLAFLYRPGNDSFIPNSGDGAQLWVGVCWLFSTIMLLCMRHWIGLVSSVFLAVLSVVSAIGLVDQGYVLWAVLQIITSVSCIIFLLGALVLKAFSRTKQRRVAFDNDEIDGVNND